MTRLTRQKKHQIREVLNKAMSARIRTLTTSTILEGLDESCHTPEAIEYAEHWVNTTAAMVGRETTATETEGT